MKSVGSFLIVIGLAAIVMGFMNYVPTILTWMYDWGEGIAWAIKAGLIVVGVIFYYLGSRRAETTTDTSIS